MIRTCDATGWDHDTYLRQRALPTVMTAPYIAGLHEGARDRRGDS